MSESITICKDYVELIREPFADENFYVVLQDGQQFEVNIFDQEIFFRRNGLSIPELALDALFNFNAVRWYPEEERMEIL